MRHPATPRPEDSACSACHPPPKGRPREYLIVLNCRSISRLPMSVGQLCSIWAPSCWVRCRHGERQPSEFLRRGVDHGVISFSQAWLLSPSSPIAADPHHSLVLADFLWRGSGYGGSASARTPRYHRRIESWAAPNGFAERSWRARSLIKAGLGDARHPRWSLSSRGSGARPLGRPSRLMLPSMPSRCCGRAVAGNRPAPANSPSLVDAPARRFVFVERELGGIDEGRLSLLAAGRVMPSLLWAASIFSGGFGIAYSSAVRSFSARARFSPFTPHIPRAWRMRALAVAE